MKTEKLNSYQKQKRRIAELESDIYNLVCKANESEGIMVSLKYNLQYDLQRLGVSGSETDAIPTGLFGLAAALSTMD